MHLKIVTDPRVYLVGRTEMDAAVVQQFLDDEAVTWTTDGDHGSELLSELAGRLCFDDQTEILTDQGWKLFEELNRTERVLTLNPETEYAEYQRPVAYQEYYHNGPMLCADGRDVSFSVTPEHRQFGSFPGKTARFVATREIRGRAFAIKSAPVAWRGETPARIEIPAASWTQQVSNQFGTYGTATTTIQARPITGRRHLIALAQLLTYYATEGSLRKQRGSGQGIDVYGDHVPQVTELCDILGLAYSVHRDPRNGVARVNVGGGTRIRSYFESECGSGACNKRLPRWVLDLPASSLASIWNILCRTDGHRFESGREIFLTTSRVLAGQIQEILAKLGHSSSAQTTTGTNFPIFVVSKKQGRSIWLNTWVRIVERPYTGKVYCLTTDNGVVCVRRDGKVHFSGNCYLSFGDKQGRRSNREYLTNIIGMEHGSVLEHVVWNFIVVGVSRTFTHELVRHRAGWAYSQVSQRFVDESTADFVEPDIIASDPELHALWAESIRQSHETYSRLAEGLAKKIEREHPELKGRDKRKRAREAARSVLPNAIESKIFISANARALRHFVEYRGAPDAEPEIRKVALAVLDIMRQEAPALFGDYETHELPDGSRWVSTGHKKV